MVIQFCLPLISQKTIPYIWKHLKTTNNNTKAQRKKPAEEGTEAQKGSRGNEVEDGKRSALADALSKLEKEFGKGTLMKLTSKDRHHHKIDVISTGSISLDSALGIGGLPKGRIVGKKYFFVSSSSSSCS